MEIDDWSIKNIDPDKVVRLGITFIKTKRPAGWLIRLSANVAGAQRKSMDPSFRWDDDFGDFALNSAA